MNALDMLREVNAQAAFNRWCGLQVLAAGTGTVEIALDWKPELGQYTGFLHAGLIGTLIDTACGFAAATVAGPNLLAVRYDVNCLRPGVGRRFVARAHVIRQGRTQIFTSCDLFAVGDTGEKLVANGQTLLCMV